MATPQPRPMQFPPGVPPLQPGQQPTPEQMQAMQQQFLAEAARLGLTPQQFGERLRAAAIARAQAAGQPIPPGMMMPPGQQGMPPGQMPQPGQLPPGQMPQPGSLPPGVQLAPGGQMTAAQQQQMQQAQVQAQQQQQQQVRQGQQVPIQPGPPKPEALAVAKFLKSQNLKSRPAIFQEKRKEMFKVKRAIRALESPAYEKARRKNPLLPPVTDRVTAENTFKLLPLSMLAIRVSKLDETAGSAPHGAPGHQHAKKVKGLWTVKIEQQQEAHDAFHYIWFYEGAQWRQKLYAAGALAVVVAVVLFPLWPYTLRRGVWYLSMACLGLLGAFFALAVVRLLGFLGSLVVSPPGIWLYPNLFEDVGFFDSFKPVWAWRETKESMAAKKAAKKERKLAKRNKSVGAVEATGAADGAHETPATAVPSGAGSTGVEAAGGAGRLRALNARVEEVGDDEE